jgi:hypothetical protein
MNKYLMILFPLILLPAKTYSQSGFGITFESSSGGMSLTEEYEDYKIQFEDYSGLLGSLNMISGKKIYSLGGKLLFVNTKTHYSYENEDDGSEGQTALFSILGSYGIYDILSYFPKLDNSTISNHLKLSSSITISRELYDGYGAGIEEANSFGIGLTANFVSLGYFVPYIGYEKYFGALSSSFNLGISLYFKTGKEKKDKLKQIGKV